MLLAPVTQRRVLVGGEADRDHLPVTAERGAGVGQHEVSRARPGMRRRRLCEEVLREPNVGGVGPQSAQQPGENIVALICRQGAHCLDEKLLW